MPESAEKQQPQQPGPVLATLFSRAQSLARIDAVLTGLVCGVAAGLATKIWNAGTFWAMVLGLVVAAVVSVLLFPGSTMTASLVSVRERFLENEVTAAQRDQMRKECLKGSLRYK